MIDRFLHTFYRNLAKGEQMRVSVIPSSEKTELIYEPTSIFYKLILTIVVVVPLASMFFGFITWAGWMWFLFFLGCYLVTMYGVAIGDHRLFTHHSFVASRSLKWALGIASCFGWQGAPIPWKADHVYHHVKSDRESDIHSPHHKGSVLRGLIFAHFGWLFSGKKADPEIYAHDLLADPDVVLISKLYPVWLVLSLVLPFSCSEDGQVFSGVGWCVLQWYTMSRGVSIPSVMCLARRRMSPKTKVVITCWLQQFLEAKATIMVTTQYRVQPATLCGHGIGGSGLSSTHRM